MERTDDSSDPTSGGPATPWPAAPGSQPLRPNGGQLYATPPAPPSPPRNREPKRGLAIVLLVFVLVASAFVGFGARDGWWGSDASTSGGVGVGVPDSERTASVDDSSGSGVDTGSVVDQVEPAIVNITSSTRIGVGAGTGLLISGKGLVLTNHHVISGADDLRVEVGGNGRTYDAHVVGYAIDDDVALVQIEDVSGLPTIESSTDVMANDPVVVIGNALGRGGEPTASPGTVTALGQQITATDETGTRAETLSDMIQIEASVQPGQSGGAVINADGEVVGMTTAASSDGGYRFGFDGSANEAYAIPIDRALAVVEEIHDGESTDSVHVGPRAILGVEIQERLTSPNGRRIDDGSTQSSEGVEVSDVSENGPAAKAGIGAGSVIVEIDGVTVRSADDITSAMNKLSPDDEIPVTWMDASGNRHTADVELAEGPPA